MLINCIDGATDSNDSNRIIKDGVVSVNEKVMAQSETQKQETREATSACKYTFRCICVQLFLSETRLARCYDDSSMPR